MSKKSFTLFNITMILCLSLLLGCSGSEVPNKTTESSQSGTSPNTDINENTEPILEPENYDVIQPLAFFSFDETDTNGNYYDLCSGNAAKTTGTPQAAEGKIGKCLYFNGKSKLELFTNMPIGNAAHTICAWIKPETSKLDDNGENVIAGWGEYTTLSDTRLLIYHKQLCVTSFGVCNFYTLPSDACDTWYHFALTYNGNCYTMYLNGIPICTASAPNGINIKSSQLYIGGFSGNGQGFCGMIDELYVFEGALDEGEILKCMYNEKNIKKESPNNLKPGEQMNNIFDFNNAGVRGWQTYQYNSNGTTISFAIRFPDDYDQSKKYPLAVFYHGDGSNGQVPETVYCGSEFTGVRKLLLEYGDCIAIVPVATKPWLSVPNDTNTVYPYRIYDMDSSATPSSELLAADALTDECINRLSVDEDRVYLFGYSRGAMASWYLLAKEPSKFAAAVECCGMGDPSIMNRMTSVPVWLFAGTADPLVAYEDFVKIFDAYQNAGGNGRFTSCENAGHDLSAWLQNEEDLVDWVLLQRRSNNK